MSKLYIATRYVADIPYNYSHLYLVYDPDDNPSNDNERVISGASSDTNFSGVLWGQTNFGDLLVKIDTPINSAGLDALNGDSVAERYYTSLDIFGLQTDNVWGYMVGHSTAIHNAELDYTFSYDGFLNIIAAQNSNSLIASVLTALGLDSTQLE